MLKKLDKPPRPDALVGTPLLGKEGKVLSYSTIFLLLFKEEYSRLVGREVVSFIDSLIL
jgi:hypothetical protein